MIDLSEKNTLQIQKEQAEFIEKCVNIAIDDELGSPYMKELAQEKGIEKGDIKSWEELIEICGPTDPNIFRNKSVEYTMTEWANRWYARTPGSELQVAETGGTTGPSKKNTLAANTTRLDFDEMDYFDLEVDAFNVLVKLCKQQFKDWDIPLREIGFVAGVPTGPHTIGKWTIKSFERDFARRLFLIDMDPRWVKVMAMAGEDIQPYLDHMTRQTGELMKQEAGKWKGWFTTGIVLAKAAGGLPGMAKGGLNTILHGGTPIEPEQIELIRGLGIKLMGFYGQSLFGTAFESEIHDNPHVDYFPHPRMNMFIIKDPNDINSRVDYGEMGTVVSQRVDPTTIIPGLVQTGDLAERVPGRGKFSFADGTRNPHRDLTGGAQIGVY